MYLTLFDLCLSIRTEIDWDSLLCFTSFNFNLILSQLGGKMETTTNNVPSTRCQGFRYVFHQTLLVHSDFVFGLVRLRSDVLLWVGRSLETSQTAWGMPDYNTQAADSYDFVCTHAPRTAAHLFQFAGKRHNMCLNYYASFPWCTLQSARVRQFPQPPASAESHSL